MKDYICEGVKMVIKEEGDEVLALFIAAEDLERYKLRCS